MNPYTFRCSRVGRVWVIHGQGQTLRALRKATPLKPRRNIVALAAVPSRDWLAVLEGGRRERQRRGLSLPLAFDVSPAVLLNVGPENHGAAAHGTLFGEILPLTR